MFNNAHLGSWRVHAKLWHFKSKCLVVIPRHTYSRTKIYIFKCVRRSNSFSPSVIQYIFLALFALHTNRKRCNQEGFRLCHSKRQVVFAYYVLSVFLQGFILSKYHSGFFLALHKNSNGCGHIHIYLNISLIISIPNIYGFMGLNP